MSFPLSCGREAAEGRGKVFLNAFDLTAHPFLPQEKGGMLSCQGNDMARTFIACTICILCCLTISHAGRYAVIMGCNRGPSLETNLKYAEKDASEFADILINLGGFESKDVRIVTGPDSSDLGRQLASIDSLLKKDKDPNSLFLFYYSGHADAANLLLEGRHYSLQKLRDYLNKSAASMKIGIFDACYSGGVTNMKGGKPTEPFYFQPQQTIKGQVIIASAAATEAAQESQTLKGSIFSHHWFNALRGSADISGSRQVTLNQAYQYAYRKTIETTALISGEIQHPVFKFDIFGQGDIVLTSLAKTTSGVLFDKSCAGKFLVLSEDYMDVYADFFKKSGAETFIALRPGAYRAINSNNRDIGTHSFIVNSNNVNVVAERLFETTMPLLSRFKGPSVQGQTPEPDSTPLSRHSFAIGASFSAFAHDKKTEFQPELCLYRSTYLNRTTSFYIQLGYFLNGLNFVGNIGLDWSIGSPSMPFFVGAGAGVFYLEKLGNAFRERMGLTLGGNVGYGIAISETSQLRIAVPYSVYFGPKIANSIGIEAQLIFFGLYRNITVLHDNL
jgi:hypothetical protein